MPLQFLQLFLSQFFLQKTYMYIYCLGSSETIGSKIIVVQPSDGACFNSSTQYEGMTKN